MQSESASYGRDEAPEKDTLEQREPRDIEKGPTRRGTESTNIKRLNSGSRLE